MRPASIAWQRSWSSRAGRGGDARSLAPRCSCVSTRCRDSLLRVTVASAPQPTTTTTAETNIHNHYHCNNNPQPTTNNQEPRTNNQQPITNRRSTPSVAAHARFLCEKLQLSTSCILMALDPHGGGGSGGCVRCSGHGWQTVAMELAVPCTQSVRSQTTRTTPYGTEACQFRDGSELFDLYDDELGGTRADRLAGVRPKGSSATPWSRSSLPPSMFWAAHGGTAGWPSTADGRIPGGRLDFTRNVPSCCATGTMFGRRGDRRTPSF